VVAIVFDKPSRESLEDLLDSLKEPPSFSSSTASPIRTTSGLPSGRGRGRRASGDRAQGPRGGHRCHGIQGRERRRRNDPLLHGHQPRAHPRRSQERSIWIVGADEHADKTLYESDLPEPIAWVLGAEGEGMRRLTRERCDLLVRIPMRGSVASLNVSVASGVCLFESRRRRSANSGNIWQTPDPAHGRPSTRSNAHRARRALPRRAHRTSVWVLRPFLGRWRGRP